MQREEILKIIEKGILAPSGDNLQPWKFRLHDNAIDLFLHITHPQHFFEIGNRAFYISCGAVIENMRIAAAHMGYDTSVTYFPESDRSLWIAHLKWCPSRTKEHPLFDAISQRTTNRKFYKIYGTINDSIFKTLEREITFEKGYRLIWLKNSDPQYGSLAKIVGKVDQIRFEHPVIYEEFLQLLRMSKKEVERTRDGLDLQTLEAGPVGSLLFRLIRNSRRLQWINHLGMSCSFNAYAQLQMYSSNAAGMIIGPGREPLDFVRGGEIVERTWLELTRENIAMQPMSAPGIFILHLQLIGGRLFTIAQKAKMEKIRRDFFSIFGVDDHEGLILLFRIGQAGPPTARSLRRPVESFLLKPGGTSPVLTP